VFSLHSYFIIVYGHSDDIHVLATKSDQVEYILCFDQRYCLPIQLSFHVLDMNMNKFPGLKKLHLSYSKSYKQKWQKIISVFDYTEKKSCRTKPFNGFVACMKPFLVFVPQDFFSSVAVQPINYSQTQMRWSARTVDFPNPMPKLKYGGHVIE
jgi:hypothetical protein